MTNKKENEVVRKNSSMASNFEEMKEHGKIMEHMSTNENVEKSGKTPDPMQYEYEESKER